MGVEIKVEVAGRLHEHVVFETEISGLYTDVGDYIRDLIRRDMARLDEARFGTLKAELQHAFAVPESEYVPLVADAFMARMKRRA